MLAKASVQAFLASTDPARARAFYEGTLGLPMLSEDEFALVFQLGGDACLRVVKATQVTPPPFTALGWRVADVAATARLLAARGVEFERYPGLDQDQLGIWSPPGGGSVAWFKDPDGNLLSVSAG